VVLSGTVAVLLDDRFGGSQTLISGGGVQKLQRPNMNMFEAGQISRVLSVGSIFGFVDYILQRPRSFQVVAGAKNALVAKVSREGLNELKKETPELERIVDKVLLLCSVVELAAGQNNW
jgi:CRP-like cAMP-binding protein